MCRSCLQRLARHRAAFDLPVGLRVLPIPADQDDRVRPKRDEILLRLEIRAAKAELPRGGALADEDPAALNPFVLGADGDFRPGNLQDVVLKLQRRQPRRGSGFLRDDDGAGGLALLRQAKCSVTRAAAFSRQRASLAVKIRGMLCSSITFIRGGSQNLGRILAGLEEERHTTNCG